MVRALANQKDWVKELLVNVQNMKEKHVRTIERIQEKLEKRNGNVLILDWKKDMFCGPLP